MFQNDQIPIEIYAGTVLDLRIITCVEHLANCPRQNGIPLALSTHPVVWILRPLARRGIPTVNDNVPRLGNWSMKQKGPCNNAEINNRRVAFFQVGVITD
jgi:hypothetical protein